MNNHFLLFAAVFSLLFAGTVRASESFAPVEVEQIEPCCTEAIESDYEASFSDEIVEVPQGRLFDEATYRMLKQQAEWDPRVPKGTDVSDSKEPWEEPAAPRILSSFDGLTIKDGEGSVPPDTIVAVGPSHVLEATNSVLRLSSKENTDIIVQQFSEHFKSKKLLFDPKVFYDEMSGRFFIVVLEASFSAKTSAILISVSRSSEPDSLSKGWCKYRINAAKEGTWADFPGLGINEQWMAVSTNQFTFDFSFRFVNVRAIDKVSLVKNESSCPKLSFSTFDVKGGYFTLQPALHYTESNLTGKPLFFVSNTAGSGTKYQVWRISGTPAALSNVQVFGTEYGLPPGGEQKGGGVDLNTNDSRVLHVVFRNGALWASHSTGCSLGEAPHESCVRMIRFTPTADSATLTSEYTYGIANQYIWMPAFAINKLGDIAVTFQRSSTKMYLSAAYNGKKAAASGFDTVKFLKSGTCHYELVPEGSTNRTGDYTGAQTDPVDDISFWIAGEYGGKIPDYSVCVWVTRIGHVKY